jgi:predicted RNA-binding Zn-ribbon protein involved in translation (DUF1610 family)
MENDGYFRDRFIGESPLAKIRAKIHARCTECGASVSIDPTALSEEPCYDCGAVGIWREGTDDEYAEYILGVIDWQEPLSTRITSELKICLEDEDVQAEIVECLEAFGDGRLARWIRSKVKDPLKRAWIARILNDFYTRDFLKRAGKIVERTMLLNAMESKANPDRGVTLYLREATRCYVFGFWDSSVALSRAAVERALKDRLKEQLGKNMPNDDEMKRLLDYAYKMRLIDGAHLTMANAVRVAGNNVLHGSHAHENDAGESLAAARGVLNHLYSRP